MRPPAQSWQPGPVKRGCAALAVDDAGLALVATLVGLGQPRERVLGGQPVAQEAQPFRPVGRVGVRLRRDRADVWLGPRDDRAHGEELRLRGDAPVAGFQVARDDRVGHAGTFADSGACSSIQSSITRHHSYSHSISGSCSCGTSPAGIRQ